MVKSEQPFQRGQLMLGLAVAAAFFAVGPVAAQPFGTAALDKDVDGLRVPITTDQDRLYKLVLDAREAGAGADTLVYSLQIGNLPNVADTVDPGADFATYGVLGLIPASDDPNDPNLPGSDNLSVRVNTGNSRVGTVQLDNFRLTDVTEGDRMINGGFENSTDPSITPPGWRFATNGAGNGQFTLITDPNHVASGNQAILIERLLLGGPVQLDMGTPLAVPAIPDESIYLTFKAKKDPNYALDDTRIRVTFSIFPNNSVPVTEWGSLLFNPGTTEYEEFVVGPISLDPNDWDQNGNGQNMRMFTALTSGAPFLSPIFKIWGPTGGSGTAIGGYFIDDVKFTRNAPSPTGNLITEGGFENNFDNFGTSSDGTFDLSDAITIDQWLFAANNGSGGGVTPLSGSASEGLLGVKLERLAASTGDSTLTKGPFEAQIPTEPRVYTAYVDARDPDDPGTGTSIVRMRLFKGASTIDRIIMPSLNYETWGITAVSDAGGALGFRFFIPRTDLEDRSVELDNARVFDSTFNVNRVTNGGFESSDTNLLDWRFFDVTSGTGSATINSDAFEGSNALLLERTDPNGADLGLIKDGLFTIGALPGETLQLSCQVKTVSRVDAEVRLGLRAVDANGQALLATSFDFVPDPNIGGYQLLDMGQVTLPDDPNLVGITVSLRLPNETEPSTTAGIGSFLIDDLSVIGVDLNQNPPNLLPNGDFEDNPLGGSVTVFDAQADTDTTISQWRIFAANGAEATATLTAAAATSGSFGLEFTRTDGICRDQDVDLSTFIDFGDYLIAEGCYTGPTPSGLVGACICLDQDGDDDVDIVDLADLQMNVNN